VSNTYTANLKLAQPAVGDRTWNVAVNGNVATLDAQNAVGDLAVTPTEIPSTTLNVKVAAGNFLEQDGSVDAFAGTASQACSASSTNYLYIDLAAGSALTVNTTGWPTTAHVRLATVATTTVIGAITDWRIPFTACGSWEDGVNLTFGTVTGTQIGTATGQKIGFFGSAPVVQPTVGAGTAGGSYTATEQGMLQRIYNAVRALGLGS
jgi:hypothetical protein